MINIDKMEDDIVVAILQLFVCEEHAGLKIWSHSNFRCIAS